MPLYWGRGVSAKSGPMAGIIPMSWRRTVVAPLTSQPLSPASRRTMMIMHRWSGSGRSAERCLSVRGDRVRADTLCYPTLTIYVDYYFCVRSHFLLRYPMEWEGEPREDTKA